MPTTDAERRAAEARASLGTPIAQDEPPAPEVVPACAADPGNHDAILDEFLAAHDDWEKRRARSDDTIHTIHESQTMRIKRVHEADPQDTA